jgi:hypothetical protein
MAGIPFDHSWLQKALLFLGSRSVIHSMEPLIGYSSDELIKIRK